MSELLAGRYQLGDLLGTGGMAEVRAARDVRLGRDVAVKVLRADLAQETSFRQRFRREAQSAARLNAPCIVSVFDTGEDERGVPFIVMERVEGRTLRDVLQTEGRLLPQRALEVAADVLSALDVAHAAGIVHRDIKPGNVMLTSTGEVKVMDFGIARAAADGASTMTQTASVIGTAAYLSPEQARGEHVDQRSDLYSTGCLLYELLAGTPPFTGDSPVAVAYQHVREDPALPSEYDETLSADVDAVVLKAMAKSPGQRYQSAVEMRDDLLRAAAGEPVAAPPPTTTLQVAEVVTVAPARTGPSTVRKTLTAVFAVVLVGIVLVTALLVKGLFDTTTERVPAPALVGLSRDDAIRALAEAGLQVGQIAIVFSDKPVGSVIRQTPEQGIVLTAGGAVDIEVSKGLEQTVVPDVRGQSQAEAEAVLQDAKLTVEQVIPRDGNVAAGTVLDVIPGPGSPLPARSKVTLVVASGQVEVPDVRGKNRDEAITLLQQAGFRVGIQGQDSAGPPDVVLEQSPVGTTAPRGSDVILTVSQTPASPTPSPSSSPTTDPSTTPTPDPTPT
ncbi:MAG: Stk1 family PASTA domain-containing Ser/Thr kinase [Mycobacteriales bacterium]|nr:Stk1 family PASTA domain-containing Ser/Thr kinase [Mycobacteriales bacterium]